jgi:hypothetical protein
MPDCTAGMLDIRSKADGACLVASGLEWQNEQGGDRCFHVQLVSWDESGKAHPLMKALMGRRIQLSIKTLD